MLGVSQPNSSAGDGVSYQDNIDRAALEVFARVQAGAKLNAALCREVIAEHRTYRRHHIASAHAICPSKPSVLAMSR
jgi:hypothetical protein